MLMLLAPFASMLLLPLYILHLVVTEMPTALLVILAVVVFFSAVLDSEKR